jgi:hypothetical protein
MYVERSGDRDDRTSHWLACEDDGTLLKIFSTKNAAEVWIRDSAHQTAASGVVGYIGTRLLYDNLED